MNVKIGDWVEGYSSGYFQVVGYGNIYAFKDDDDYKKGQLITSTVNLKQGFTSKMKFKLGADFCAIGWIKPLSDEVVNMINEFWKNNPQKKQQFDNYTVVEQLGDLWYQMKIVEDSFDYWKMEVDKLPLKICQEQFIGWFDKRMKIYERCYAHSKRKKHEYFITTNVIPESVQLGKPPLFEKPKLLFGQK